MSHFLQTCTHIHYQVKLVGQRFYIMVGMNCICVCWDIQQFIMLICILFLSLADLFLTEQGIVTSSQTVVLFQKTSSPTSILGKVLLGLPPHPPPQPCQIPSGNIPFGFILSLKSIRAWVPLWLRIFNNLSFGRVSMNIF